MSHSHRPCCAVAPLGSCGLPRTLRALQGQPGDESFAPRTRQVPDGWTLRVPLRCWTAHNMPNCLNDTLQAQPGDYSLTSSDAAGTGRMDTAGAGRTDLAGVRALASRVAQLLALEQAELAAQEAQRAARRAETERRHASMLRCAVTCCAMLCCAVLCC
jgi:hypothetical protein